VTVIREAGIWLGQNSGQGALEALGGFLELTLEGVAFAKLHPAPSTRLVSSH
jgi:hypothetical protein